MVAVFLCFVWSSVQMSSAQDVIDQPYDFLIQKDRELREASYLLCVLQTAHHDYKTGSYSGVF